MIRVFPNFHIKINYINLFSLKIILIFAQRKVGR
nr:MAG TPA: hypothetical protein [Bacteriophage sp.]